MRMNSMIIYVAIQFFPEAVFLKMYSTGLETDLWDGGGTDLGQPPKATDPSFPKMQCNRNRSIHTHMCQSPYAPCQLLLR